MQRNVQCRVLVLVLVMVVVVLVQKSLGRLRGSAGVVLVGEVGALGHHHPTAGHNDR